VQVTVHAVALARPGVDGGNGGAGTIGPGGAGGGSGTLMVAIGAADDGAEVDNGRLYCWFKCGALATWSHAMTMSVSVSG